MRKRADVMLWTRWPQSSRDDLVFELFDTHPEVYDLYRAPQSKLPPGEAKRQIAKAADHQDAWSLLSEWASG